LGKTVLETWEVNTQQFVTRGGRYIYHGVSWGGGGEEKKGGEREERSRNRKQLEVVGRKWGKKKMIRKEGGEGKKVNGG